MSKVGDFGDGNCSLLVPDNLTSTVVLETPGVILPCREPLATYIKPQIQDRHRTSKVVYIEVLTIIAAIIIEGSPAANQSRYLTLRFILTLYRAERTRASARTRLLAAHP